MADGAAVRAAVAITPVIHLLSASVLYLGFLAIGFHPPYATVVFIVSYTTVIALLPISLNGIGVYESAFVLLCSHSGIGSAEAFSVALLTRVTGTIVSSTGGVLYVTRR